jgi:PAS domain S-box-containing protein
VGYLAFAACYVLVYAVVGWALSGHPQARSAFAAVALIVPPAATLAVVLRRRREWHGGQRLFWDAFAIGMGLWVIGHIGWVTDAMIHNEAGWLRWHTVFSLAGGIGPLVALLARPDLGVRQASAGAISILLASYALFAVFIYSYFVLIPGVLSAGPDAQASLLGLVQVNRLLLMVGMIAGAWVARRTRWRRTFMLLAIGASLGFFLRIATSYAIIEGSYKSGSLHDLAWIVPFLMHLWAVREAPVSTLEAVEMPGPSAVISAVPVLLLPLIGYGFLFISPLGVTGDSVRSLLTGVMTVVGVGLLTLRLSVQGGALQRSDERVRLLAAAIEQTGDSIVITRADGTIEHANDAFLRGTGYSREEIGTLTASDMNQTPLEMTRGHIFAEVSKHGVWRGTLVRRRRDGTAYHAASTVVALKNPSETITHLVGVERDITEDMNLRDQLVHTERLSAMGALVAGVAHEINNPLQTILGSAEVLLEEQTMSSGRPELELVRHEAGRAAQIVRNLLSFVRRTAPDRVVVDLNAIAAATVELRHYHLERSNIVLDVALHPEALPVFVNREEIQQIVLNLVLNAEQALESRQGGRISIRTLALAHHRVLEVADDGPGISKELRGRIFEPFFTTKEVGEGTGLGLSISHGIAYAHGGSLELCTRPSAGACFRLTLPAHEAASAPPETATPDARPDDRRSALVVDDELPIRRLLRRLLERRGFHVVEAESGEAAVALARERSFQLVLCDVRMPVMSGVEFYTQICALKPALRGRFVFMSGDAAQARSDGLTDDVPILKKPFTSPDLDAVLEKTQI